MPAETESDSSTGIYRCNDISAFKFRVHIRTFEASGLEEGVQDDKHEEQVFSWQQRVFSPHEIQFYSDPNNCSSPLHQSYHKEIKDSNRNSNNSKNILFSYLLPDLVHMKLERDILLCQNKLPNHLSETTRYSQKPQISQSSNLGSEDYTKDALDGRCADQVKSRYELMYIMADVGYLLEGEAKEHILVVMKWDSSLQVLTIFPDFNCNTSGPGYLLEGLSDACNQYVFWIVPESSHFDRRKDHQLSEPSVFSPTDMYQPRHGLMNVHVFGEIKGARYFEFDNIFLCYHFELPDGWSCQAPNDFSGITQQAKKFQGFVNLNHLFEITLSYNLPSCDKSKMYLPGCCEMFPKLFFDVVALDDWGRVRKEGCCWVQVLPISGQHNFRLQCWRPMDNLCMSGFNMLKRYFIGGAPHLANISFNGIPETFQGTRLSKFGVKEVATGELDLCLNIILHSQSSAQINEDLPQNSFLERFSALSLLQSVNVALKAFLWARKRIQTAIST